MLGANTRIKVAAKQYASTTAKIAEASIQKEKPQPPVTHGDARVILENIPKVQVDPRAVQTEIRRAWTDAVRVGREVKMNNGTRFT